MNLRMTINHSGLPVHHANGPPGANLVRSHLATEDRPLLKRQGSTPHWLRLHTNNIIPWGLVAGSLQQEKIPSKRQRRRKTPQPMPVRMGYTDPIQTGSGFAPVSVRKGSLRPCQPQRHQATGSQYPCERIPLQCGKTLKTRPRQFLVFKCLEKPMLNNVFLAVTEKQSEKMTH